MIMRDVNNGWAVRYTHANVASFFFIFVYAQCFNTYFNLLQNLYFFKFNQCLILFNEIINHFNNMIKPKTIKYTTKQKIHEKCYFTFNIRCEILRTLMKS